MTAPACCSVAIPELPLEVGNRSTLSAVAYRIGTFGTFRRDILRRIAASSLEPLHTRASDDVSITVVDLWAAVADILTFYQERIGNEAWLRTATSRDAMLRLVRLLGYELHPGSAAMTNLAFTLDRGARLTIPAELRVQSVPGEGEKPQKFETLEAIAAEASLNRLRIGGRPRIIQPLAPGRRRDVVSPDPVSRAVVEGLAPGDRVMVYATGAFEQLVIDTIDPVPGSYRITWSVAPVASIGTPTVRKLGRTMRVFGSAFPRTYQRVTGTTTTTIDICPVDFSLSGDGTNGSTELALDTKYDDLKAGARLLVTWISGGTTNAREYEVDATETRTLTRTATTTGAAPVTFDLPLGAPVTVATVSAADGSGTSQSNVITGDVDHAVIYELMGEPLQFSALEMPGSVSGQELYVEGLRVAPDALMVADPPEKEKPLAGDRLSPSQLPKGRRVIAVDESATVPRVTAARIVASEIVGAHVEVASLPAQPGALRSLGLEPSRTERITALVSGQHLVVQPVIPSHAEMEMTLGSDPPRRVALGISDNNPLATCAAALQNAIRSLSPGNPAYSHLRVIVVANAYLVVIPGVAEAVPRFAPTDTDIATVRVLKLAPDQVRYIDGLRAAPDTTLIPAGSFDIGVEQGLEKMVTHNVTLGPGSVTLSQLANGLGGGNGGLTTDADTSTGYLTLLPKIVEPAPFQYLRLTITAPGVSGVSGESTVLLGNVALASHGETVRGEVVGDGDASVPFQKLPLQKKPVTHLPAPTPSGVRSSLQVMVNGVRWSEDSTLYGADKNDEIFVPRIADDGTATLLFGDGFTGSRLPTGRGNVTAKYRVGIGVAGRVRARTLTTLLDRPTGLKGATNPLPADGGADPERLDDARRGAPASVRTFGRAVSLRDFEDIARTGEVAKASASWVWSGRRRVIVITVASQGGAPMSDEGRDRVRERILAQCVAHQVVRVLNVVRVPVVLRATLTVDDRHAQADVLTAARSRLFERLSFDAMAFLEPVNLSDAVALLQSVPGVQAVDVDELRFKSRNGTFLTQHGADPNVAVADALRVLPARADSAGQLYAAEQAMVELADDVTLVATGGLTE